MKKLTILLVLLTVGMGCFAVPKSRHGSFCTASYNIRYANASDSAAGNGWGQRYPVIAQIIRFHGFDIFGTQEGYLHQLQDLKNALPGYAYIGVGRNDGKSAGEHSAIFYRTDKFELLEKGDFWLSQTPESPSVGWDAVLPRICSWGHFRCKDTGFEFLFFNLHMDHVGKQARVESAYLVQRKMKELGADLPVILTGDFNVDQTHDSYKVLTEKSLLRDAYVIADYRYAANGTFNDFQTGDFTESRIDHVFVSQPFQVTKYGILTDTYRTKTVLGKDEKKQGKSNSEEMNLVKYQARTPSDHFPVQVLLRY